MGAAFWPSAGAAESNHVLEGSRGSRMLSGRARRLSILLALTCSLGVLGVHRLWAGNSRPRLVLLYATCTVNRDYLGPYNPAISFTPNLNLFAAEGVVFQRHRTEASLSGVAYASLFTGNPALLHGVFTHPVVLPDAAYTIAEAFDADGYETYFWGGHSMASSDLGYAQGVAANHIFERRLRSDDPEFRSLLEQLQKDKKKRAFVVTNFSVTHGPYHLDPLKAFCRYVKQECSLLDRLGPEKVQRYYTLYREHLIPLQYNFEDTVKTLDLSPTDVEDLTGVIEVVYRANVFSLDRQFGALLAEIGQADLLEDSLIVFTADHGETLRRPGAPFNWSHGHTVRSDVLDVPLIVHAPRRLRSGVVEEVTRSIDVFPTVASLADIKLSRAARMWGRDLSALLEKGAVRWSELTAISHSAMLPEAVAAMPDDQIGTLKEYYPASDIRLSWVAVRKGDMVWKYRRDGDGNWAMTAFNVAEDPGELRDVFDPELEKHRSAAAVAKKYKEDLAKAFDYWKTAVGEGRSVSKGDEILKLRSLGYIE